MLELKFENDFNKIDKILDKIADMNLKEWKKKVKIIGIIQSENYSEKVKMAMRNLKSSGAKYRRASNHSGYS